VYFVGASTHPGTGVPIVLAGAKITSMQILEDRGITIPWRGKVDVVQDQGVKQGKGTRDIDRVQKETAILSNLGIWISTVIVLGVTVLYINSGLVISWNPELKKGWGSGRLSGQGIH
jgi:phytoene desaturase (3,4-didehydrolycopene-forming)